MERIPGQSIVLILLAKILLTSGAPNRNCTQFNYVHFEHYSDLIFSKGVRQKGGVTARGRRCNHRFDSGRIYPPKETPVQT